MGLNSFKESEGSLSDYELSPHDSVSSGDSLTTVQVNKDFRSLLTSLLLKQLDLSKNSEVKQDNEQLIENFLIDMLDIT